MLATFLALCALQPALALRTTYNLNPGWRWRNVSANASGPAPGPCADSGCAPHTDDSAWRALDVPHDGVVEGDFSESENASGGFLPPVSAWYRRHLALPPSFAGATMWLELDGVMQSSSVFLNGAFLGNHSSGFTTQRYFLSPSVLRLGQDNVLAVWHCSAPLDGWWYNGGGIVRGVSLTVVSTPGPFLSPWGIYAPSVPTGAITFSAAGAPSADAELLPSIDVGSLAPGAAEFVLSLLVVAADGSTLASSSGSGSAAGSGSRTTWSPTAPLALPQAALWHLVAPPLTPALYTLVVRLSVGGVEVDAENVTFGVRSAVFNNATGFWLNGVRTKIQGFSNHQDSAAVGVAVPAHMQWNRVALLKACGANAWRTAHNPPAPALLAAADELGLLVMDEDHRNGQDAETPLMVLRDRNHPSVILWSVCNEILCSTGSNAQSTQDAARIVKLIHQLDPSSGRPVTANSRADNPLPLDTKSPLDVLGFDYSTEWYDRYHAGNPTRPSLSTESSSAYSDRGEWVTTESHVSPYNEHPQWGQDAEAAWGGIGVQGGQGIMTRDFIAGGMTWTGHDYVR